MCYEKSLFITYIQNLTCYLLIPMPKVFRIVFEKFKYFHFINVKYKYIKKYLNTFKTNVFDHIYDAKVITQVMKHGCIPTCIFFWQFL